LLDALPRPVEYLDLQGLGDELRRHHAAAELPRLGLVADRHDDARQVAAERIDDGELQRVVRLRLQLQLVRERAALVKEHLVGQPCTERTNPYRSPFEGMGN